MALGFIKQFRPLADTSPRGAGQRLKNSFRDAAGLRLAGRLVFDDGGGDGIDALQNLLRGFGVGDLEAVSFVEGDDELQGVHGIQADAAGAEQRLVVADFFRAELEHEILDHQFSDVLLDCGCVVHCKIFVPR